MENRIHAWLDAMAVPWLQPRKILAERFGVQPHPAYQWDVIHVKTDERLLPDMLWPLSVQRFVHFSAEMPATEWSTASSSGRRWQDSLERGERHLSAALGPSQTLLLGNCVSNQWSHGAARVTLSAFPPEWDRGAPLIDAHRLEPRLATACHFVVTTGHRPTATGVELLAIAGSALIVRWPVQRVRCPQAEFGAYAAQAELEYIRGVEPAMTLFEDGVGLSADRRYLLFRRSEFYLIPVVNICSFVLTRQRAARGPIGAFLAVEVRGPDGTVKQIAIHAGDEPDCLTVAASAIAIAVNRPLRLPDDEYHC